MPPPRASARYKRSTLTGRAQKIVKKEGFGLVRVKTKNVLGINAPIVYPTTATPQEEVVKCEKKEYTKEDILKEISNVLQPKKTKKGGSIKIV